MPKQTNELFAKTFMTIVYQQIKHGDVEHKRWLREECTKLEKHLVARLNIRSVREESVAARKR